MSSDILTDDEYAILMIANEGSRLIPIGRWEKSVRNLHANGLLEKQNEVNYVITDVGRIALASHEAGLNEDFRKAFDRHLDEKNRAAFKEQGDGTT